jgi:hypothetical protein
MTQTFNTVTINLTSIMAILSKSEIFFLQDQKKTSKSYKLKSIVKKKLTKLADKGLHLISSLSPNLKLNLYLAKNGKHSSSSIRGSGVQIPHFAFKMPQLIDYH